MKRDRILAAARSAFLRFGYRRVSMSDIADEAGVSRASVYLLFRNKEEVFVGVLATWTDETLAEIRSAIAAPATAREKLEKAFDIWLVRPFALMNSSPEARELVECSFGFAQSALREGYAKFQSTIAPLLAPLAATLSAKTPMDAERTALILANAMSGLKQAATTPDDLRALVRALLDLTLRDAR